MASTQIRSHWIVYHTRYNQVQTQYKPSTDPVQTQYKPSTNPVQTQYKPSTNPVQTQYKPQYRPSTGPSTGHMTSSTLLIQCVLAAEYITSEPCKMYLAYLNRAHLQYRPSTNPVQTQYRPSTNPVQTQYKPSTNPVQTQYKPSTDPVQDPRQGLIYLPSQVSRYLTLSPKGHVIKLACVPGSRVPCARSVCSDR